MAIDTPVREADGVFEGGGVKGIALVGGLAAAEAKGFGSWKNVAGTSAGAIVASLVAVGYDATRLEEVMRAAMYPKFADYGAGGLVRGVLWNQLWMRGLAPGEYFRRWLTDRIAESPLAKEKGTADLRFEHVKRDDLPADITPDERARALYRLQVIASDVSAGRMLVLPNDIAGFSQTRNGPQIEPDTLRIVDAVRMSMSYPYLFRAVTLWRGDTPHYIVDGGLLSNFPIWLFDVPASRTPKRPTLGFRLHGGTSPEEMPPYHKVPMPLWRVKLLKAMFESATGAWDAKQLSASTNARTVSIPTGSVPTTKFDLTKEEADGLYASGRQTTARFFELPEVQAYLAKFRAPVPQP